MGYSFNSLTRLLDQEERFQGKKVLTLGTLYPYVRSREAEALRRRGLNVYMPKERFSTHLFVERLGALSCHSLDVSAYQQSDIICNLNHPLPPQHLGQYDVVFDGGTLEHLANLSMALTNIFGLLRNGGIYYFGVPCNNWVDHGFFQFSPTFFRDLCIDNPGLELHALNIGTAKRYYDVAAQNPVFIRALLASRQRLSVGGVIRKKQDSIDLNLTQSKYRNQHATSAYRMAGEPIADNTAVAARSFASVVLEHFIDTVWLPLGIKEVIINHLYRLKHGTTPRVAS